MANIQTENSVLAGLIMDESCQRYIEHLEPIDFSDHQNKKLLAVLKAMYAQGKTIDVVTVGERFSPSYVADIASHYISASNFEAYYKELKSTGIRRQLYLAGTRIQEIASKAEDGLEAKNEAMQILSDVATSVAEEVDDTAQEMFMRTLEYIETRWRHKDDDTFNYQTPFPDLNRITGGLHPEELTVVAARPGVGKTAIALQICESLARRGKHVVFVSREMSITQLGIRLYAKKTGLNSWNLRTGHISEDDFGKLNEAMVANAKLPLRVNSRIQSVQEVRSYIRERQTKGELDLLCVDYLQLLKASGRFENREKEISHISNQFKSMSMEFQIPILLLSQLNRSGGGQDRRPVLSDLRESGAIEQDADNVLFLYEPSKDQLPAEVLEKAERVWASGNRFVELIIAKQRNGPRGTIYLGFEPSRLRFYEMAGGESCGGRATRTKAG